MIDWPRLLTLGVHAVLQAGGSGRRLLPATDVTPKPLLEVDGVPMIERLLRQLVDCGVDSVTVVTGWLGDQVEDHLSRLGGLSASLNLRFLRETRPLGNIGALAGFATQQLPVLMAFGDLVTDMDFAALVRFHHANASAITLASHHDSYRLRFGELLVDGERVTGYREKPDKRYLICSGVAVFEPHVLGLIDDSRPTGISDLVSASIEQGHKVVHWPHEAFWMDINSAETLAEANRLLSGSTAR